ncbi:MAG: hypothetical protein JXA33_25115 [Anaerolineae bacterium]|nr:hypothetical protein [Anaerolineae bacterium]
MYFSSRITHHISRLTSRVLRFTFYVLPLLLLITQPTHSQNDPATHLYALITEMRLNEGTSPLYRSTLLDQAAQRHAADIAPQGSASDTGSDGSTYQQRIRETGYRAWNDGLLVTELIWMGLGDAEDAMSWFATHEEARTLLAGTRYREIGIGYATDNKGAHYFVLTLGSRPGVLPIFINDGADSTHVPAVAISITNEEAVPLGEGNWMGRAIEVRINDTPDFTGISWQSWEPLLPWLLVSKDGTQPPPPGDYAVYVEFRDGAGRTAVGEDTIHLVDPGETLPTPTPHRTAPTPTSLPDTEPAPVATETEAMAGTAKPTMVTPPLVTDAHPQLQPTMTLQVSPTQAREPIAPFPTWTPLSVATPAEEAKPVDWPLLLVVVLQGIALLLLFAVFLRRR